MKIVVIFLYQPILTFESIKAINIYQTSYLHTLLDEESQESPTQALEKAVIFMIDAYSDSGIIEKENVVIMLKDIMRYYQRSGPSVTSEKR